MICKLRKSLIIMGVLVGLVGAISACSPTTVDPVTQQPDGGIGGTGIEM